MPFLIGALIGAALGIAIDRDAWLAGAIIGGVIGWLVGRKRGLDKDDRHAALEQRLDRFDERLVRVEPGSARAAEPVTPPAPAPVVTPAAPEPPPESAR